MDLYSALKQRKAYIVLLVVVLVYAVLFAIGDNLQGALWDDERGFWETTLEFSSRPIPSIAQIRDYNQFNTPFPFILYGMLEHAFGAGPFSARLINFVCSFIIVILIGRPGKADSDTPILAVLGLCLFPWYLWLSTRLYTDIIASFFVVLGFVFYLRERHGLSGVMFIVAIACRQFMLAFPVAIAFHELILSIRYRTRPSLSFFLPLLAALSIVIWVLMFGGLTPSAARGARYIPEVQRTLWALSLGNGLFFLATIGWGYVIPELILFRQRIVPKKISFIKLISIATVLLVAFLFDSPEINFLSVFTNVTDYLSFRFLYFLLMYSIALLTCWRFSQINLAFWILTFNTLIMTKAVAWDKYALPIIVVLWYLKAAQARQEPLNTNENLIS